MKELKQVIILRNDINMSCGKKIAQASHASLKSYKDAPEKEKTGWEKQGSKKITVEADKEQLQKKLEKAKALQIPNGLITDAGKTELEPQTITALALGPAPKAKINKVTSDLPLVK